jgi:hypothetical protein
MNRLKLIIGIIITVIGGGGMITAMVFGIIEVAGGYYINVWEHPVNLSITGQTLFTDTFEVGSNSHFSIWLKLPDRQIENKSISISGQVNSLSSKRLANFSENFNFGYVRNSSGKNQYYRLGQIAFDKKDSVFLSYKMEGKWSAPYDGYIVFRKASGIKVPVRQIIMFLLATLILIVGIVAITKS